MRTSLPVADFPSAWTVVPWSRCRWEIALFCRGLKQGGQREPLRVQTEPRVLNALALDRLVAWRLHSITRAGRASPAVPCDGAFDPREWHTSETRQPHRHPPPAPPTLGALVWAVAQRGGV